MSEQGEGGARVAIPLWALLHLTHAVMQAVADDAGVDIVHVKGPSVAPELRTAPRMSMDVDVLVRPAHLPKFLAALREHGWRELTSFAEGSSFAHAANWGHRHWANVDVHRYFPGPRAAHDRVFEALWVSRQLVQIAHTRCAVPDLAAQVLILALHEARAHRGVGSFEAWELSGDERRQEVWALARALGAEVPLAAAVGRLDEYRDRREYLWWKFWSEPESGEPGADRLTEWTARLHAARGVRERAAVLGGMLRVNKTHLRLELGHVPSRGEVIREYRHRAAAGWHAVTARARLRWISRRGRNRVADSDRSRGDQV